VAQFSYDPLMNINPLSKLASGSVARSRPLCSYPQRATYSGSGSTDEERNSVCR